MLIWHLPGICFQQTHFSVIQQTEDPLTTNASQRRPHRFLSMVMRAEQLREPWTARGRRSRCRRTYDSLLRGQAPLCDNNLSQTAVPRAVSHRCGKYGSRQRPGLQVDSGGPPVNRERRAYLFPRSPLIWGVISLGPTSMSRLIPSNCAGCTATRWIQRVGADEYTWRLRSE